MSLNVVSSKLTATPNVSGWVQAHEFTPQEDEKKEKRGSIYAVIATKTSQEGVEAVSVGREIITRLHEEYFADLEKDSYTQLQNAVKKITTEFSAINLEIGVIAYVGENLYAVGCGGAVAQVIRDNSMVVLLDSKEEVVSVSGKPNEADVFLLGTKAFFSNFEYEEIKKTLLDRDLKASVEEFAPKVHASPNLGSAGFLVLKFVKEQKKDQESEKVINLGDVVADETKPPQIKQVQSSKPAISSIFQKISQIVPAKQIKLKVQDLNQSTPQGRKTTFTAGVVLLVLLIVSVGFGINQKRLNDLKSVYGTKLESAMSDYNEALSVFELDKTKARELFLSAKEKLDEIQNANYKDERIDSFASQLSSKTAEILGEYSVPVNDFLDLTLQTAGFDGSDLSSSAGEIFVLDKQNKQIIKVEIAGKKASIAAGSDQVGAAKQVGSYEGRFFVLTDDGIFELGDNKDEVVDKDWENPLFYLYSGNIYLLDKTQNTIYRYPGIEGGFSEKSDWLAPGIEADFSKITDMSIDGSIWLLSSSGKVSRFTQGSPQAVSLNGLSTQMVDPRAIYTNEEQEYVYVLDPNQQRIVVLEKGGEFKVQYSAEAIKDAKDLVVSESEGKIILLTGSKLLSIELKHL